MLLGVMLHVVAGLHLRREPFELLGKMIERRIFHACKVGNHPRDHAAEIDRALLILIADQIDVGADLD